MSMRVYTYHQTFNDRYIDSSLQRKLVDLWKLSWARRGYEPIVLNLKDAKKHPQFGRFDHDISKIFRRITGRNITHYGLSCWHRWLAYANQGEGKFYVSDYDAINVNFPITEPSDKLHFYDSYCPFLASGTPKQFENLCEAFITVSNERLTELSAHAHKMTWYHDQDFLYYNLHEDLNPTRDFLLDKYELNLTRTRAIFGGEYDPHLGRIVMADWLQKTVKTEDYKVAHISHNNTEWVWARYPKLAAKYKNADELRLAMIRELIENS